MKLTDKEKFLKSPPSKSNLFKKYWKMFILQVVDRKGFHAGHRELVIILCDLYVEYHTLVESIAETGYSIYAEGRYGTQIKTPPEVVQKNKTIVEIRNYTRELSISLDPEEMPVDEGGEWLA